jgi:hypothetical protein
MKRQLNKIIEKIGFHVLKQGVYLVISPTSKERVKSLIDKLKPYQIDKDLLRLGPNGDGGYLIPNDLDGIKSCFSPGVDKISDFEQDCVNRGMKIYMADKSVDKPNLNVPVIQYNFIKKHIGCTNNADFTTMDQWVDAFNIDQNEDLLLQMDIEGGEYSSLLNISDALMKRFRIIVIEFHSLEDLWNPHFFSIAESVFDKILQTHTCVHIHPNNYHGIDTKFGIEIPRIAEFTFLRNDRAKFEKYQVQFPHKLDYDNSNKKSVVLPKNWYRGN